MQDIFYVYMLIDPRNNKPFYIGKGKDNRYLDHFKENRIKKDKNLLKINKIRKIKKLGLEVVVKFYIENVSNITACQIEKNLIEYYGRIDLKNGILTNLTDGGDGVSGKVFSEIERKKLSEKMLGDKNPNYGNKWTEEQKEKLSEKMKLNPTFKGKHHSEEHKKYISSIQVKHSFWQILPDFSVKFWESFNELGRFYNLQKRNGKFCLAGVYQSLKHPKCQFKGTYLRDNNYENIQGNKLVSVESFLKEIENSSNKKTIQKSLDGKVIKEWNSRTDIKNELIDLNIRLPDLSTYIKKHKPYKGFLWENS